MTETILLELPDDVLLTALRRLSPARRRRLLDELDLSEPVHPRYLRPDVLDRLSDLIDIGGDALHDSENLYDDTRCADRLGL